MSILPRDWKLLQRNYNFENLVPIRSIPFKCIFVCLEKHLWEEKKMNAKFHWHYISVWSIDSETDVTENESAVLKDKNVICLKNTP